MSSEVLRKIDSLKLLILLKNPEVKKKESGMTEHVPVIKVSEYLLARIKCILGVCSVALARIL